VTVVLMNDWMGPSLSRGGAGNDMSLMWYWLVVEKIGVLFFALHSSSSIANPGTQSGLFVAGIVRFNGLACGEWGRGHFYSTFWLRASSNHTEYFPFKIYKVKRHSDCPVVPAAGEIITKWNSLFLGCAPFMAGLDGWQNLAWAFIFSLGGLGVFGEDVKILWLYAAEFWYSFHLALYLFA
jgi:hypothetical protein